MVPLLYIIIIKVPSHDYLIHFSYGDDLAIFSIAANCITKKKKTHGNEMKHDMKSNWRNHN